MVAIGVMTHHRLAFMVQGCHSKELVPRTSTEKPNGFRSAGDILQMDEEEEVRLLDWILTNTKIDAVMHLWRSGHLLNFDFYRVTRMKLHIALQPLVFVGQ